MFDRIRKSEDEREGGFTLIELLVVIIIIGILAAIAIPVFLSQRTKGYDAQSKSDLRNFATQQETYNVDNNTYGTGAAVVAANGTFRHSAVLDTAFTATGFCIVGNTSPSTKWYLYDSSAGGLQTGGGFTSAALAEAGCTVAGLSAWAAVP